MDYQEYMSYIEDVKDALKDVKDALERAEREGYDCEELSSGEVDSMIVSVQAQLDELEELDRRYPTTDYERYGVNERDFF